jgi:succinyldiaminopimelate transaminase
VDPEEAVLPVVGTKELVAWLPTLLGLGAGDVVVHPALAYPTYDVGARLAGAEPVACRLAHRPRAQRRYGWCGSTRRRNPDGRVLPAEHMAKVVAWARERGAVVASDECYLEFGWDADPVSILHPDVCGGSVDGVLAVHSLSKRSSMAGYRAGAVAGDPALVAALHEVRRHAGMVVPAPVQAAMVAAFDDDEHVGESSASATPVAAARSARRCSGPASGSSDSEGSLYLWATRDEPATASLAWLAEHGVLVAPGHFYGPDGARHVRVSLTATDERVAAAVSRLGRAAPTAFRSR